MGLPPYRWWPGIDRDSAVPVALAITISMGLGLGAIIALLVTWL